MDFEGDRTLKAFKKYIKKNAAVRVIFGESVGVNVSCTELADWAVNPSKCAISGHRLLSRTMQDLAWLQSLILFVRSKRTPTWARSYL